MSDCKNVQIISCRSICRDCAFFVKLECSHPDEMGVNCATVIFCNSFTSAIEIDSPCVTFGNDDEY